MSKLRLIVTNSLIYSLTTVLSKGMSFILLPLFTYYLSKEDYGILGVIMSITSIVSAYIGLNPPLFLIVKGPQKDKREIAAYIYNAIILSFGSFIIALFGLFFLKGSLLSNQLEGEGWILFMIATYCFCNSNIRILDTVFQIEKKAFQSSMLLFIQSLFSLGLALVLVVRFSLHWKGFFFADFFVTVLFSLVSLFFLYQKAYISFHYDREKITALFQYLFPLTFHVSGFVIIGSIDKLLISNMMSLEAVGIYNIACTVGMIIGLIHDSFLKALNPFFFEAIYRNDVSEKRRIVKATYLYVVGSIVLFISFLLILPYIFTILINEKFHEALSLTSVIALGYTVLGIRNTIGGYLYHANKTKLIAMISVLTAALNISLNYYLIQHHGLYGAAESLLYSYLFLLAITFFFANKYCRMPWLLRLV